MTLYELAKGLRSLKYKGPSIAELNKQAKMHNVSYGQYIAMKEMGLCQES